MAVGLLRVARRWARTIPGHRALRGGHPWRAVVATRCKDACQSRRGYTAATRKGSALRHHHDLAQACAVAEAGKDVAEKIARDLKKRFELTTRKATRSVRAAGRQKRTPDRSTVPLGFFVGRRSGDREEINAQFDSQSSGAQGLTSVSGPSAIPAPSGRERPRGTASTRPRGSRSRAPRSGRIEPLHLVEGAKPRSRKSQRGRARPCQLPHGIASAPRIMRLRT